MRAAFNEFVRDLRRRPGAREGGLVCRAPAGNSNGKQAPLKEEDMSIWLLVLLAVVVVLFVGLGFVVKWLFIIAAIAALIC